MKMQQTLEGADPETAITAPEQAKGSELPGDRGKCVVPNFSSHKLFQPLHRAINVTLEPAGFIRCHQECTVVVFE